MEIWFTGFENSSFAKRFTKYVENGFRLDGVVVDVSVLFKKNRKVYKVWERLHEIGVKIIIAGFHEDVDVDKFEEYFNKVASMDFVDCIIEPVVPINIDTDKPVYKFSIDSEYIAVKDNFLSAQRKYKGKHLIAVGLGSLDMISKLNDFDAVITGNWNAPSRGVIYYSGKLVRMSSLQKSDVKRIILKYDNMFTQYGVDDKYKIIIANILSMYEYLDRRHSVVEKSEEFVVSGDIVFGCYNCILSESCPAYKPNSYKCILLENKLKEYNLDNLIDGVLKIIIREKLYRYLRGRIFEDIDGGELNKLTTDIEDSLVRTIELYMKLKYPERFKTGAKTSDETEKIADNFLKQIMGDDS